MMKSTGRRLSAALLGFVVLIILLLTLNPFYLATPRRFHFTLDSDLENLVANVVLFLPVGFLYKITSRRRGVWLVGAALSLGIETLQLFMPARTASVVDLLSNTLGAGLGGIAYDLAAPLLTRIARLALQHKLQSPLMGVIYMFTPLLWLNSFDRVLERRLMTTLVGICGAIIISAIYRHNWRQVPVSGILAAALSTGAWFLLATGPALIHSRLLLGVNAGLMLLTATLSAVPVKNSERRFEQATLKWVLPIFALYIACLALLPLQFSFQHWHAMLGFTSRITETNIEVLAPRLEYLAAFTIFGYLLAEWRGRAELSIRQDLPRLIGQSFSFALGLELFLGFQSGQGASLIRTVMVVAGALFGGVLYHLLRAHIRFLLGHNGKPNISTLPNS